MSWPTSAVNAVPVSWGARSTTVFATTASATASVGVAGAGAAAGAAAWVVSCAASEPTPAASSAARYAIGFMSHSGLLCRRVYGAAPSEFQPRPEGRGEHSAGGRAGGLRPQLAFEVAPVALGRPDPSTHGGPSRLHRLDG